MKSITSYLHLVSCLVLLATPSVAQAQPAPVYGGFSFINCTRLLGTLMLKVDGSPYRPAGYLPGAYSQGGQLAVGSHSFSLENEGATTIAQSVTMAPGDSVLCIGYTIEKTKADGRVETFLKLMQLADKPKSSGFHYTGLYVSEKPSCTLYINKQPIEFPSMKLVAIDAEHSLRVSSTPPDPRVDERLQAPGNLKFNPAENGDYLLVIFDGPDGKPKFCLPYHTKD